MACKLSPIISVDSVKLDVSPYVEVSVVIEGVFSDLLKDGELSEYIRAVCVLSIYDPVASANANTVNPESVFELNGYWANTEWYKLWDGYLRAEKVFPTNDTVFEFDLLDLIDPTDDSNTTKKNWSEAYLSYFTYIQVDTQQMAEDFNIAIADEYKGLAGDYKTGVIMIGGEVVDADERSFAVQDLRTPVEVEPVDASCGVEDDSSQSTDADTDTETTTTYKTESASSSVKKFVQVTL